MKQLSLLGYTLRDWRLWCGLGFSFLVACMMSYTSLSIALQGELQQPVVYYFLLSFSINLAMSLYILTAASTAITDFAQDYHQNRIPFLLSRMSPRRYATRLVVRLLSRSYFVGFVLALCFCLFLSLFFPLEGGEAAESFANHWLLEKGFVLLFYLLLISLIGLYFAYFTLLGGIISVFYPNKLMTYLFPSLGWFVLTQFRLEFIFPYFMLPHIVLSTDDYLQEGLTYFQVGDEGFREIFSILYPYVFMGLWAWLAIELIRLALVKHWHFYDKE